jgi:hypothetical protein
MNTGPNGELLSPKAAAHVATFASNLFRITSTSKDAQHLPRALRESVLIRDQEMVIPRSEAYDIHMFEVMQPVEYRTAPTLETVTGSGYQGPAVGSMIWAKHVVTHFRDNGYHVEMVHCAGGWLPICAENGEFLRAVHPDMEPTLHKVIWRNGVALRCSSDPNERMPPGRKEACTEGEIIVIDAFVTDPNSGQRMAHSSSAGGWLPTTASNGGATLELTDPEEMTFLNLRVLDPMGTVRWMSNKYIRPEQRRKDVDPDAFERPRDCPVHRMVWWVPRVDDGDQTWRIRSDDAQLALQLKGMKTLNDVATASLELRRKWLRHELEQRQLSMHSSGGPVKIWVRRESLLDDLVSAFSKLSPYDFNRQFLYAIKNETDFTLDVGGVSREVYLLAQQQLFNPDFGLFMASEGSDLAYMVNPNSGTIHPNHLNLFKLAGQIFGKMMLDGMYIQIHFVVPMYKFLLRLQPTMSDLESVDHETYDSLKWMMDNDITDILYETFSVETKDAFSEDRVIHDLMPGGREEEVDNGNKMEYIRQRLSYILCTRVEHQRVAFASGLFSIIPSELLSVFTFRELELLACGVSSIDVDDWEKNTVYRSTNAQHQVVKWFWQCVREFNDEQRCKLLQFTTGTTNLPVEGFAGLQSARGVSRLFQVTLVPTTNPPGQPTSPLPRAHTCFNTIDLPAYPNRQEMMNVLSMVIELEATGFEMDE